MRLTARERLLIIFTWCEFESRTFIADAGIIKPRAPYACIVKFCFLIACRFSKILYREVGFVLFSIALIANLFLMDRDS